MTGVLRAVLGYLFLIFVVRIVGRRPGKQITPFEFILVFFMGGVTLTPLVGDDRSLTNALCQITTVACVHYSIAWLRQRFPRFGLLTDGTPLVLLDRGKPREDLMTRMGIRRADIGQMSRDQGLTSSEKVEYAVLERNGEISIIPKDE